MTRIRVDPTQLRQASDELAGTAARLRGVADEALQSAASAPSYDGQFAPRVKDAAAKVHAALSAQANRLSQLAEDLSNRAAAFEQAEAESQSAFAALAARIPLPPIRLPSIGDIIPPWLVELILSLFPFGDAIGLLRQFGNWVRSEPVDGLDVGLSLLGLVLDVVGGPIGPDDAGVAALKGIAGAVPPGPAREALEEMVQAAIKNPDEAVGLAKVAGELAQHPALLNSLLTDHPEAIAAVLAGGPEAIELLARHSDEAMALVGKHGDEALRYLGQFEELRTVEAVLEVAENGRWVAKTESMSEAARAYQRFITGRVDDQVFELAGTTFDGFDEARGVLLEAKAVPDNFATADGAFQEWVSEASRDQWVRQATNQIQAAGGAPLEWYFSEPAVLEAMKDLFIRSGVDMDRIILLVKSAPQP